MRVYNYTAIIKKNIVVQDKVTYRSSSGRLPLDSEAKTGHVLAESPSHAKEKAIHELKGQYPAELGYQVPESVRVEEAQETIIEVNG